MIKEWFRVGGAAVVMTMVVFLVGSAFDTGFKATTGFGAGEVVEMTWFHVLAVTLLVSVLAIGLAHLLRRFERGRTIYVVIAVVVFILSFTTFGDLRLETNDLIWQGVLHGVFAIVLVGGIYLSWPEFSD